MPLLTSAAAYATALLAAGKLGSDYAYSWREAWYTQNVDQFNFNGPTSTATFQQRYLINDTWWKPGGPIFFYCGECTPLDHHRSRLQPDREPPSAQLAPATCRQ